MNNQAAQTMPELPGPFDVIEQVDKYNFVHNVEVYTADQMHQYARDYAAALSQTAGVPSWIVNDLGELGVMVNGVAYFLYKGDNIVYEDAKHDDGSPMLYRMVGKREFGEVCHPRHWEENGWAAAHRYTQELVYTPGLSFGKPEDGDWRPLPAKGAAPAASGVHPDALQDGTLSKSTAKRVTALAGASVSERNPGSEDAMHWIDRYAAGIDEVCQLDRVEQALTQQRGEAIAMVYHDMGGAVRLVWDSNKVHENPPPSGTKLYAHATTPQPSADAVREVPDGDHGLAEFTEYFVKNYPGPDTIIYAPEWHAPKIFRAARRAMLSAASDHQQNAAQGGGEK